MKTVVLMLIFGLILATNAFALLPGTPFTFTQTMESGFSKHPGGGTLWHWTHNLENTDFTPALSGSEILDITSAGALLAMKLQLHKGDLTLNTYIENWNNSDYLLAARYITDMGMSPFDYEWSFSIPSRFLDLIEDREVTIWLYAPDAPEGKIKEVYSFTLSGKGVVAPEPTSMMLTAVGLMVYPILKRIKGNSRHRNH